MTNEQLQSLINFFGPEKQFISDGYYRIRVISNQKVEMAFLVPDSCGTTSVHPQITVTKTQNNWEPINLIDMAETPTKFIEKSEETAIFLNNALEELVQKFKSVM